MRIRLAGVAVLGVLAALLDMSPASAAVSPFPNSIVSTGDSITRAFDANLDCLFSDCPRYSWSTGDSSLPVIYSSWP